MTGKAWRAVIDRLIWVLEFVWLDVASLDCLNDLGPISENRSYADCKNAFSTIRGIDFLESERESLKKMYNNFKIVQQLFSARNPSLYRLIMVVFSKDWLIDWLIDWLMKFHFRDRFDGWSYVFGAVAVGIGIFLALNQMLMICCIAPLVRGSSTTSEHVTSHLVTAGAVPVSSAYQGGHPYAPPTGATGSSTQVYPYIDEPIKEEPPSYNEATRHDNIRPTAPPEKV